LLSQLVEQRRQRKAEITVLQVLFATQWSTTQLIAEIFTRETAPDTGIEETGSTLTIREASFLGCHVGDV